jgi:lysine 2,3-aminomutase
MDAKMTALPFPRKRTARTAKELAAAGLIAAAETEAAAAVAARYAVAVPPALLGRIDPRNPADPVARQFVPDASELVDGADELTDPIGDRAHSPLRGIVHRYPDRVLLQPVSTCAVYCRYCFRREQVGPDSAPLRRDELDAALAYIRTNTGIWEVILSGGDPLVLAPGKLARIVAALAAMDHVGVIRIHSRVPVATPERVTAALIDALRSDKAVYVVLHVNHAQELGPTALAACRRLSDAGIPLLSQSVLLRGVNDDAATLETLFRTLLRNRIKPYYLHHPDRARGTARFRLPLAAGQALMKQLRGRLSGLAQPTYVLDIPGGFGKVPVGPGYLSESDAGWSVEDPAGIAHAYLEPPL